MLREKITFSLDEVTREKKSVHVSTILLFIIVARESIQ